MSFRKGLNEIPVPNNCVRENSLWLSGYGVCLLSKHSRFKSGVLPVFLLCICSFASLLQTLFSRLLSVPDDQFLHVFLLELKYGTSSEYEAIACIVLTHYQMTNFRLFQIERLCRRQFQV